MAKRPGEFELIERYFRPLATDAGAFGLADDAAVFKPRPGEELLLKTDLIAEGVHFFRDDPPASIARKALRVNLSDIASKGGTAVGYLLSLALPDAWTEPWIRKFASGLAADQKTYGVTLFGGDTSRASGGLTISVAAIGRLPKGTMVRRSGARPGDFIYVSGTVGDAALGLAIRLGRIDPKPGGRGAKHLLDRYLHPQPRTALAPVLRRHANAAMDVSDGLVGDLAHICRASGVGAEIEAGVVPLSPAAAAVLQGNPSALTSILTGGDDYEILATVKPGAAPAFERDAKRAGVPVTRIGRVTAGRGTPVVIGRDGKRLYLDRSSYDHFG